MAFVCVSTTPSTAENPFSEPWKTEAWFGIIAASARKVRILMGTICIDSTERARRSIVKEGDEDG
jgi:hypothetical protein